MNFWFMCQVPTSSLHFSSMAPNVTADGSTTANSGVAHLAFSSFQSHIVNVFQFSAFTKHCNVCFLRIVEPISPSVMNVGYKYCQSVLERGESVVPADVMPARHNLASTDCCLPSPRPVKKLKVTSLVGS